MIYIKDYRFGEQVCFIIIWDRKVKKCVGGSYYFIRWTKVNKPRFRIRDIGTHKNRIGERSIT